MLWQKLKNFFQQHRAIIMILSVAFLLRLINILKIGDFLWDELFSFNFSQLGWSESWKMWLLETNPPLHMIFLKLWFLIFPKNEFFTRLPSLFFGLVNVYLLYIYGKKYLSEKVGLLSAFILAIMPYHIFLSGFGRGYTLLLSLTALSIYFFTEIITNQNTQKKSFLFLAIINLLMFFTHLTAVLIILAQFIILLKYHSRLKNWILFHLPVGIITLTWTIFSFWDKLQNPAEFGTAWFFNFNKGIINLFDPIKLIFFGPANSVWIIILLLAFTAYLIKELTAQIKKSDVIFFILLVFFFVPILNTIGTQLWNIKFFVIAMPACILIFAYLIQQQIKNIFWGIITIIIIACPGLWNYYQILPLNNWGQFNKIIEQNIEPNKKNVLISNKFIDQLLFDKYYTANTSVKVYFPAGQTPSKEDIVGKNYLFICRSPEEIELWMIENKIEEYGVVFLLQDNTYGVDLKSYFDHNPDWKLIRELPKQIADPNKLFYYAKD